MSVTPTGPDASGPDDSDGDGDDPFEALFHPEWAASAPIREPSAAEREQETAALHRAFRRDGRRTRRRNRVRSAKKSLKPWAIPLAFVAVVGIALWFQYGRNSTESIVGPGPRPALTQRVRIIELVPSDKTSLPSSSAEIARTVDAMRAWFPKEPAERPSGKTPRVVLDGGEPKVERVVVDVTASSLATSTLPSLEIGRALEAAGFGLASDEAAIVVARIRPTTPVCGETTGRYAVVFPTACTETANEFSPDTSTVMAHELLHVLGAVDECAPHYGRHGHVTDDPSDIMYEPIDANAALRASVQHIDPGLDDYWGITTKGCLDISTLPIWTTPSS